MAENNNQGGESSNRGFASMNEDEVREIASKGGSASGGNFKNDPERAAEAGREGGKASAESRSEGGSQGGGNQGGGNQGGGSGQGGGNQGGGSQGGGNR